MYRPITTLVSCALVLSPGLAAQERATVAISRADCARLVAHLPSADVAYQPGVDVHGRPVTTADLNAHPIRTPDDFTIEIDIDLFERFGIPVDPTRYQASAKIGEVEVRGDRAYFNGQPLQDEAQADFAERCREGIAR